jgi:hypothetical protein
MVLLLHNVYLADNSPTYLLGCWSRWVNYLVPESRKKSVKAKLLHCKVSRFKLVATLLNGKFYQSSPEDLVAPLQPDSTLIKHWVKLTQPERGKKVTPAGTIIYLAEPVIIGKKITGCLW